MNSSSQISYLYILKSTVKDWYYIGVTNNIQDRLERHNSGRSISTKAYRPFEMFFFRQFDSKAEAMKEEARLKSFKNKETILKYINEHSS